MASNVLIPTQDAFAEHAGVPSDLMAEGMDPRPPALTIAIPTFRRFDLMVEAVGSALAQAQDGSVEVIVIDNDPTSRDDERLLAQLPQLRERSFRYYRNRRNIGMLGNWNRAIELGRGPWHSMLHDDDLLDSGFARTALAVVAADPRIDGVAARKRNLDQRRAAPPAPPGLARRTLRAGLDLARFGLESRRQITPRNLFFANPIGNPVCFMARKADLLAIGGYQPRYYPSHDHYLFARFAQQFRLMQLRCTLGSFRMAVNETMAPDVIRGFIVANWQLQQQLAGTAVPSWWRRLSPLSAACEVRGWNRFWGAGVDPDEVARLIGQQLPRPRKKLYMAAVALLGGL